MVFGRITSEQIVSVLRHVVFVCVLKKCSSLLAVQLSYRQELLSMLRFSVSSQAKHGGACFSAVGGSIIDSIAVPGQHQVNRV